MMAAALTSDNTQRAYTAFTYDGVLTNVQRLSNSRVWADNWTGINGIPYEVTTQYSVPGDGSCQLIAPDGTVYKEFYGTGWQKGLTTLSEVWSGGVKQKWTTTAWTQDNTSLNYHLNPRPTETNAYDAAGNRRRVTVEYHSSFGLPWRIREYAADAATVLRITEHQYITASDYLNRRVIGLPERTLLYDGSWGLQAKTTYSYDWGVSLEALPNGATAVQHDSANFGLSFVAGRGNVSQIVRWDVTDPDNFSKAIETMKYGHNVTGSVTFTRDPLWHQNFFSYTDSFSDNINRNTFAYPTTLTDGDWQNSYVKYNFDFGAVTRTEGPPPANQSVGRIQTSTYDGAGRLDRVTTTNNGAYTRFVYGTHYVQSYATVNTVADQAYAVQTFDGLGRNVGTASNHPGSSGGYKAQLTQYDQMGRAMKKSNPAEMNGSWVPAGDDVAGWLYTQQSYDWNGRPLVTTNTDLTTRTASYGGCGCAGGEVVTLTDEGTLVGGVTKKRQQKIYSDVLGRTRKTEILNWNGAGPYGTGGTVYSATVNTYNVRDQITLIRQYADPEGSGTYQDTTMSYDGFGRLKTRHVPEQNAGNATEWFYNADDTVQKITDARGASQIFSYNGRHLVEGVTYSAPGGSGITVPAAVDFNYDGAGNCTSMTDGLGSVNYGYNQLSQLGSEARSFTGVGTFSLTYSYNLAGQLSTLTDPFGAQVSYGHDTAGRVSAITGSPFAGVTTYLSNLQYRAWGGLKSASYGNSKTVALTYDSTLRAITYEVPGILKKSYQYYADGQIKFAQDQMSINSKFDRWYAYDHAGRVVTALSGAEARGGGPTDDRPYKEFLAYQAFDHFLQKYWDDNYQWVVEKSLYYVRSSVLGGAIVSEVTATGNKERTFVYGGDSVLALHSYLDSIPRVDWRHVDPGNISSRSTDAAGQWSGLNTAEMDPLETNAGLAKPFTWPPPTSTGKVVPFGTIPELLSPSGGCVLDGVPTPCEMATVENSVQCTENDCSPRAFRVRTDEGETVSFLLTPFRAMANGVSGNFLPDELGGTAQSQADLYLALAQLGSAGLSASQIAGRDVRWGHNFFPSLAAFPQNSNTARNLENDPCDSSVHGAAIQSDLSEIAKTIGGKLDAKWNIRTPRGLTVETAVGRLEDSAFAQFRSYNPEHPGINLQGQLNGRWYHVTVSPAPTPNAAVNANQSLSGANAARNSPSDHSPSRINKVTAHCEKNKPDSVAHFWDYVKSFFW